MSIRGQQSRILHAFRMWQQYSEKFARAEQLKRLNGQKRKQVKALIRRWRLGALVPTFETWRDRVVAKKARRLEVLDRTCKRIASGSMWRAMRQWRDFAEDRRVYQFKQIVHANMTAQKKARVNELITRWRQTALIPAFQQWTAFVVVRRAKKRAILDKTVKRLEQNSVWRALRTWQHFSEQCAIASLQRKMARKDVAAQEQRKKMAQHLLIKWKTSREKARFLAWRQYTQAIRAKKREVLDRTLKHMANSFLAAGWRQWLRHVDEGRLADVHANLNENKRRTAQQVITRWRHRICTTPFLNWKHYTQKSRQRKRELMDRMVKRMTNLNLHSGFRTWKHFISQTKLAWLRGKWAEQKEGLDKELAEQKRKRIVALVQRWRGQSMATRFQQWRMYARTNKHKKRVRIEQVFRRMIHSSLWQGWRQWLNYCSLHKAHLARIASTTAMEQFQKETRVAAQNVRQRHILTKTLDRMANLLLFSGWRQWKEYTQMARAHDITLEKRALEAQTVNLKKKQAELIRQHTQLTLTRKQQIVDKTLRRIAYATVYRAIRVWKKFSDASALFQLRDEARTREYTLKRRMIATKILQHKKDALVPILRRWLKHTEARKQRKLDLIRIFVNRFGMLKQWNALRQWRQAAHLVAVESMEQRMRVKLNHQKKERVIALVHKWRHRAIEPTFIAWKEYARGCVQRKMRLRRILSKIDHIHLGQAFRSWRQRDTQRERQRIIIDRTIKRMVSSALYRGLRTWMSYTDLHRQAQVNKAYAAIRQAAVSSKVQTMSRLASKTHFLAWRTLTRQDRRERQMVTEMTNYHRCNILDRTYRRIQAATIAKSFTHWRTWILRARLIVNDKLGEYSEMILTLRQQSEMDSLKLHEYLTENQKLKSNLLSIKHKQHTMSLMTEKQKENRAILFAYNTILAKSFRAFYQRVHFLRKRKLTLHRTLLHVKESVQLRSLQQWKKQTMIHRSVMMQAALENAKKQLDQCLGKVWSLESQLAQRSAEAEQVATESQQVLLNAQAQEMNHQLEKQMPNQREIALAQEVDTLAAKLELLLKEVRDRGNHITFLSAENQRLSSIVKGSTSGQGPLSTGFPSPSASSANTTLNLSSSFVKPTPASIGSASTSTTAAARTTFYPKLP